MPWRSRIRLVTDLVRRALTSRECHELVNHLEEQLQRRSPVFAITHRSSIEQMRVGGATYPNPKAQTW